MDDVVDVDDVVEVPLVLVLDVDVDVAVRAELINLAPHIPAFAWPFPKEDFK